MPCSGQCCDSDSAAAAGNGFLVNLGRIHPHPAAGDRSGVDSHSPRAKAGSVIGNSAVASVAAARLEPIYRMPTGRS